MLPLQAKFNKQYLQPSEDIARFQNFIRTSQKVHQHNELADKGQKTFRMAVNQFADYNQTQIDLFLTKSFIKSPKSKTNKPTPLRPSSTPIPNSVDWREAGIVGPVQDEGQLERCAPFAVVGAIEGALAQAKVAFTRLSTQQVLDCQPDGVFDNKEAYDYILSAKGLESETSYPRTAAPGKCNFDINKSVVALSGAFTFTSGNESQLQELISESVLSTELIVTYDFMFYSSGVFTTDKCANDDLPNFALLNVGYGMTKVGNQAYWILQSSWGSSWGEGGAIRFARNGNNMCKVASYVSGPVLEGME